MKGAPREKRRFRKVGPVTQGWIENFWTKVDKSAGPDACWPWLGMYETNGYPTTPKMGGNQQRISARAVLYYLTFKKEPGRIKIFMSCDNRKCCNPKHMMISEMSPKARESFEKSLKVRAINPRWKTYRTSLDPDKVREIRKLIRDGKSNMDVARQFEVSDKTISLIRTGKRWKHVKEMVVAEGVEPSIISL